ncbi:T9SS type A sorting domain-containing protein [Formosa sp. A9]|uniref:T9SS type A sorting domain-containing protein n=1 Tax=Formosa sp. A9 TaxID=3442641 RepID=UPI003EBF37B0
MLILGSWLPMIVGAFFAFIFKKAFVLDKNLQRKILLFTLILFFVKSGFGQISFEDKVNIYDHHNLSNKIIYDDFDKDGDLDIIKHNIVNSKHIVLQKNESGNFNAIPPIKLDVNKQPILSLDLNNDGYPDLITYYSYKNIGVLHNLQNDTFGETQKIADFVGSYTIDPLKFDYNKDGFIDLILIDKSYYNNDAYVLINNKTGGFQPAQFLFSLGSSNSIYKIDDIDNDGDFDFYVLGRNVLRIYLNEEDNFVNPGILQAQSQLNSYVVMDFDGNGIKDILYWKNESFWVRYFDFDEDKNEFVFLKDVMQVENIPFFPSTTFSSNLIHVKKEDNEVYSVYIAIETQSNHSNIYKFKIQDGVFEKPQVVLEHFEINNMYDLAQFNFLDLNNDTNLDFTFTSGPYDNEIFINNDIDGSEDKTICIQQFISPNDFSIIDMNGDGKEDICIGTDSGLGYFEIKPNNELSPIQHLIGVQSNPNTNYYTYNNITDFNNDGLGDVVDFKNYRNYIKFYKNLGNDNFEFIQSISLSDDFLTTKISFADIDSDGFQDIIFDRHNEASGDKSGLYWIKNNKGVDFGVLQPLIISGNVDNLSPITFAYDDFNKDGETDILVLNYYYKKDQWITEITLFENDNEQFSENSLTKFNDGKYDSGHLKIKDVDLDGDLDFFLYNTIYDSSFIFFKNDGQNNFEPIVIENLNIEDIEFYDNDEDGIYEIYAWNYDKPSYMNNIFYYTTTDYLTFNRITIDSYKAYYDNDDYNTKGDLLLYDYNNDGKHDLFIDNFSTYNGLVSVYKNVSETLGVEEIENNTNLNQLKLYPNPFVNSLNWNSQEGKFYNLQLFSQTGKLLFEKTNSKNSLDLSSCTSGVYFLSIQEVNSASKHVYKIIKK